MKRFYYLLLLVTFSVATYAQTNWVTKKLDQKLSVKFPAEPQKTVVNGIETYNFKDKDSTAYSTAYSAAMVDLKIVAQLDSATLAGMKDNPQFAEGVKQGMAAKKTNYTFGDVTLGKWKTYSTYTFAGTENTNKNRLQAKIILIGSKMYTLTCLVPAKLGNNTSDVFMGSAELVK